MSSFYNKLWRVLKNVLLLLLAACAAGVIISLIGKIRISRIVLYISIFYMVLGLGWIFRSFKSLPSRDYTRSRDMNIKEMQETTKDSELSHTSYRFLQYMLIAGILLMFIGFLFDSFNM